MPAYFFATGEYLVKPQIEHIVLSKSFQTDGKLEKKKI